MLDKDTISRLSDLYSIVEKEANVGASRHGYITGEAMDEINQINEQIKKQKLAERVKDPNTVPGTPADGSSTAAPVSPSSPRMIPSQTFDQFNTDKGIINRRLPTGADVPPDETPGEPSDQGDLDV